MKRIKVDDPKWQKLIDKHPHKVVSTAAGPMCTKCGRGVSCWLAPDESPCNCDKSGWDGSLKITKDIFGNEWAST